MASRLTIRPPSKLEFWPLSKRCITPEMTGWPNEGDYNIITRNNTIRPVTMAPSQGFYSGLTVNGWEYEKIVPYPGGNRIIVIEGNVFEGFHDTNIVVTSSVGVETVKYRFIRPMHGSVLHAGNLLNYNALIYVREAGQITLRDNLVTDLGESYRVSIDADSSVQELEAGNTVLSGK